MNLFIYMQHIHKALCKGDTKYLAFDISGTVIPSLQSSYFLFFFFFKSGHAMFLM
jgi:hypothetical protein